VPWTFGDPIAVAGAGVVTVPMGGARLSLTTIPAGMGRRIGPPDVFHDLGYVVWIVADRPAGYLLLRTADSLLTDPPRGVTGIAYSLLPGVSGTLAPAWWEPGVRLGEGRLAPEGATAGQSGWMVLG
jgi:hypothetical protein